MKQRFNGLAPETYRDEQRRLEQRAQHIEKQLNTPQAAQPQLRPPPGAAMRIQGNQAGQQTLKKQRVDVLQRLEINTRERAQQKALEPSNAKENTSNKDKSL